MQKETYDNIDVKFDAVLRTMAGKTIEAGRGQYDPANETVDFEGEFVPLFAMGTQLEIMRIHDGVEVHRFVGEVYLSSAHVLRLISVRGEILPDASLVFLYYVSLEGTAKTTVQVQKRVLLAKRTVEQEIEFSARVHALSVREIKFNTDLSVELDPGQQLTLRLNGGPGIEEIPLQVRQAIVFGQEANCYQCRIGSLGPVDRHRLEVYVRELSEAAVRKSL